jgi:hypothetical protein
MFIYFLCIFVLYTYHRFFSPAASLIVTTEGSPMMVILLALQEVANTSRVSSELTDILIQSGNITDYERIAILY